MGGGAGLLGLLIRHGFANDLFLIESPWSQLSTGRTIFTSGDFVSAYPLMQSVVEKLNSYAFCNFLVLNVLTCMCGKEMFDQFATFFSFAFKQLKLPADQVLHRDSVLLFCHI